MHPLFAAIRGVGFDLDRTLYSDTPEMKDALLRAIGEKIVKILPTIGTAEHAIEVYEPRCRETGSWRRVFAQIGAENPQGIMQECLASANIVDCIAPDEKLAHLMERLSRKYFPFIITGSPRSLAHAKLKRLGINPGIFRFTLYGDDAAFTAKNSSQNFQYFLSIWHYPPSEFVYIGDNPETDIAIPKALGMKTIAVGTACEIADFSVSHIHEIEKLLL